MKHIGLKYGVIFTCLLIFACQNEQKKRKERIIDAVENSAVQLSASSKETIPFDSVYVSKVTTYKDSLSFYKKTNFVGSAIIQYEE